MQKGSNNLTSIDLYEINCFLTEFKSKLNKSTTASVDFTNDSLGNLALLPYSS